MNNTKERTSYSTRIKKMTALAVFCALAYICEFVFKFRFQFLTFDAKDAVMTIGGMFFGPVSAAVMSLIVSLAEFVTISDTGLYGLIMNFAASAAFTVTASLIYKYKRKMSGAILGLSASVFAMTSLMVVMNLIITPLYMGMPAKSVAEMIPTLLLPFNIIKALFNAALVLLLYKPITTAMRKAKLVEAHKNTVPVTKKTTVILALIAIAIVAISLTVFFAVLKGEFSIFK